MYNISAVYYLQKQGGTPSLSLPLLAQHTWHWARLHHIHLMEYLLGMDNNLMDLLSCDD